MNILFLLIPISLLLAGTGLAACIWAIRSGQYKDMASPAQSLVFEDSERDAPATVDQLSTKTITNNIDKVSQ